MDIVEVIHCSSPDISQYVPLLHSEWIICDFQIKMKEFESTARYRSLFISYSPCYYWEEYSGN